jgi:hypothetical protein
MIAVSPDWGTQRHSFERRGAAGILIGRGELPQVEVLTRLRVLESSTPPTLVERPQE